MRSELSDSPRRNESETIKCHKEKDVRDVLLLETPAQFSSERIGRFRHFKKKKKKEKRRKTE